MTNRNNDNNSVEEINKQTKKNKDQEAQKMNINPFEMGTSLF